MGVPKEQATRNRQGIIDTASRIFRERGVDGVGVADLMKEAGFTHGGFYNHFASKEALAAEACAEAFAGGAANLKAALGADADHPQAVLRDFMEGYLSSTHCDAPGTGCPTAAMAIDAARHGRAIQAAYARGIETFVDTIAPVIGNAAAGQCPAARESAIRMLAGLVGALVLARGVGTANPALSEEILGAGRKELADREI